jgi:hypothetical protein
MISNSYIDNKRIYEEELTELRSELKDYIKKCLRSVNNRMKKMERKRRH